MPDLQKTLSAAQELKKAIDESLQGLRVEGSRHITSAAYMRLAICHFESVLLLFSTNHRASALALVRPCTDAIQRAVYVLVDDSEQAVAQIEARSKYIFPKQESIVEKIHANLQLPVFADVHSAYEFLCDFNHGGFRQLERQIEENGRLNECVEDDLCFDVLIGMTFPVVFGVVLLSGTFRQETKSGTKLMQRYATLLPLPLATKPLIELSAKGNTSETD